MATSTQSAQAKPGPKMDASQRVRRFLSANWWEATKRNVSVFVFFLKYVKPYISKVILAIVAKLIATPLQMIAVFLSAYLIDQVILNDSLPFEDRMSRLVTVLTLQVVLWGIGHIQGSLFSWIAWYVNMRLTIDIQKKFYLHQHSLPLSWHRSRSIGEHMYRTDNDLGSGVISMITDDWIGIFDILYQIFWAVLLFSRIDPTLGIIAALFFVPWSVIYHTTTSVWIRIEYRQRELHQESQSVERDVIAGLRTFKSLGRSYFVSNRYGQIQSIVWRLIMWKNVLSWWFNQGIWWLFWIVYERGTWLYVWARVMDGAFTIGQTAVIFWMLSQLTGPFQNLFALIQRFRSRMVPALRMLETFSVKPAIVERQHPIRPARLRGDIAFEQVSFGYEPQRLLLDKMNMAVRPGMRMALVGPSGTGKSTILNLLLRLYDPLGGRVMVDGIDLRDMRLRSYLARIGVVLQETFLFSGSVFENVRYGNPVASERQVRDALTKADLDDTIAQWPEGLNTFMGEGTNASGGQKQRIGIARALLREPSMFLLDEPTAHLDIATEQNVMQTIENVTRGHTTLIVSHRIAPVLFVDQLAVVAPGGIETVGTHADLLRSSGTYRALWEEQQGTRTPGLPRIDGRAEGGLGEAP